MRCVHLIYCVLAALVFLAAANLHADPAATAVGGGTAETAPKGLMESDSPLPDPGGLRAKLSDHGVALGVIYTGEVFGNPVGGYRQGAVEDGLLTTSLDVDFEKLIDLKGFKLHVLAYDPHGASGTEKYTRDLGRFSNIDAYDTFHLFELWLETSLFDNIVSLRAGQLAVDAEFATTIGGALFINGSPGDMPIFSLNVPVPVYAEAAPGVRLRLNSPDSRFYFQAGVYSGNPDADRIGDPSPSFQPGTAYNDGGVRFPISGNQGAFSIYEAGYLRNYGKDDHGLPGAYRIGGFYHTDTFSDDRFDNRGRSLANPLSTGRARSHDGDGGIYAVAEQVVFRPPGENGNQHEDVSQTAAAPVGNAEDSPLGAPGGALPSGPEVRAFGRVGLAPEDRNLADFYLEAGLNYRGLLPRRGRDVLGVAFTYTDISGDLRQLAREENRFNVTRDALPDYEAVLEITYQINAAPWLQVQPDLQYIIHPGGSPRYGDALVIGARTVVTF